MPNIHLTTSQATHEDVNNMVAYRDANFRTKARRLFLVYIIAFVVTGVILSLVYGFRDKIIKKFPFMSFLDSIDASSEMMPEDGSDDKKMNVALVSNTTVGIDINTLYFEEKYEQTYAYGTSFTPSLSSNAICLFSPPNTKAFETSPIRFTTL